MCSQLPETEDLPFFESAESEDDNLSSEGLEGDITIEFEQVGPALIFQAVMVLQQMNQILPSIGKEDLSKIEEQFKELKIFLDSMKESEKNLILSCQSLFEKIIEQIEENSQKDPNEIENDIKEFSSLVKELADSCESNEDKEKMVGFALQYLMGSLLLVRIEKLQAAAQN